VLFLQLALPYGNEDKEALPKISNTPNLSQSTRLEKTKDRWSASDRLPPQNKKLNKSSK
jgi:hypothetical protein